MVNPLLKDRVLLVIGFFLFCQSGFEAIVNNWTTTYLLKTTDTTMSNALYALSLYVGGMAVMRLLVGSVFRKMKPALILTISFGLLFTGSLLLQFSNSYFISVCGLICLGAGLAAGFPVMLGFVGNRYQDFSGTAFSMVISIALIGNILINYTMGVVANAYGVEQLITIAFILTLLMCSLSVLILKKVETK